MINLLKSFVNNNAVVISPGQNFAISCAGEILYTVTYLLVDEVMTTLAVGSIKVFTIVSFEFVPNLLPTFSRFSLYKDQIDSVPPS